MTNEHNSPSLARPTTTTRPTRPEKLPKRLHNANGEPNVILGLKNNFSFGETALDALVRIKQPRNQHTTTTKTTLARPIQVSKLGVWPSRRSAANGGASQTSPRICRATLTSVQTVCYSFHSASRPVRVASECSGRGARLPASSALAT
jgi:hypothetical protein